MSNAWLTAIVVLLGAGWGLTQPVTKIIVTGGYEPFGIIFWQMAIGTVLLGAAQWKRLRQVPFTRKTLTVWLFIAAIGTLIPNATSYRAAFHLPAGIMSIIIASVPIIAFPVALLLRNDRFSARRLLGLAAGLGGVALIALPEASLPERAMVAFLPLALIAPFCYAIEGNVVAKFGTAGLDPVQVLFGASATGAVIALPLALATGQMIPVHWPLVHVDYALLLNAAIHVVVYTGYVWMVGRAGAVFAGQVAYLVTGFGVLWSMLLLGERYSGWVWGALAMMALGLALVQPRQALENKGETRDTAA